MSFTQQPEFWFICAIIFGVFFYWLIINLTKGHSSRRIAWLVATVVVVALAACFWRANRGHGGAPQTAKESRTNSDEQKIAALHEKYGCPILGEEVRKLAGTNALYSIHVQDALKTNEVIITSGMLHDIVRSHDRVEAIFYIGESISEAWSKDDCIALLECPTNFVQPLISQGGKWAVVFEVTKYGPIYESGDDAENSLGYHDQILIEGKLTDVQTLSENETD